VEFESSSHVFVNEVLSELVSSEQEQENDAQDEEDSLNGDVGVGSVLEETEGSATVLITVTLGAPEGHSGEHGTRRGRAWKLEATGGEE